MVFAINLQLGRDDVVGSVIRDVTLYLAPLCHPGVAQAGIPLVAAQVRVWDVVLMPSVGTDQAE